MSRHVRQVLRRVRRRTFPPYAPHLDVAVLVAIFVAGALLARCCA